MRGELTAHQVDTQLGGLMIGLASVVVNGAMSAGNCLAAAREERQVYAYADALERATRQARLMETVATQAISDIVKLEAEVASLRAACAQRQAYIDRIKGH